MMLSKTSKGSLKSAACALVSVLIAAAMVIAWLPGQALAEVRKADEVFGKTVEERQLTVADCPSLSSLMLLPQALHDTPPGALL